MRKLLPLLLAGFLLLSGCGKGQVTDDASRLSETITETNISTSKEAVQTETTAESTETTAPTTTAPTTQRATEIMTTTTTTNAPAAPAENGSYAFTAQYFRTNAKSGETRYPQCFCVGSASALGAYVEQASQQYSMTGFGFPEAVRQYDDAWFSTHTLLVAVLEESSGSVGHTVTRVEKTAPHAGTVEIKRDVPEVGTCDMAEWHILIELPAGTFAPTDTIEVVMQ